MPVSIPQQKLAALLAELVAPAAEAVTIADHNGFILAANDTVERVYGWPLAQILGQHALKFCPDTPQWKKLSEEVWRSVQKQGHWDGAVINQDAQGEQFPILLRVRKLSYGKFTFAVSWARPFPHGTPFGLTEQEARAFRLLAEGYTAADIAVQLPNKSRNTTAPAPARGLATSTVNTHLLRVWIKAGHPKEQFSIQKLKVLAVRCLEAGWESTMRINSALISSQPHNTPAVNSQLVKRL